MKINRLARLFLLLTLILVSGCNLPMAANQASRPSPVALAGNVQLATVNPNASPTPTPFLPVDASPTSERPSDRPSLTPSPEPTSDALINRHPRPEGQVNIMLFGSDFRPGSGYRTDVMMLVSLNPKQGTASVISFPRDLYVNVVGWQMHRLNTAQAHGGFATTQATFAENFGVPVDHYIMTNMEGFIGIVNTLGGIDVESAKPLSDRCDLPQAVNSYCNIGVGTYHMDGRTALWYVRSRYSTSDFDRTRRAQEVVQAIFLKLLSLNAVGRAPELWSAFSSSVETDLTLGDITPLLPLANQLQDTSRIHRYAVGPEHVTPFTSDTGMSVLGPNLDVIWPMIEEAIYLK